MSFEYPIDKMELPELELIFTVVKGIRTKYRSQANRFITFGIWPKIEGVSHNDLIHIIGRLSNAGYIKRRTGISMLIGLSIEITDSFEPFYDWVEATIELRKIELEGAGEYVSDEPLIYKLFNIENGELILGDESVFFKPETYQHDLLTYMLHDNVEEINGQHDYKQIFNTRWGLDYDSENESQRRMIADYARGINNKIRRKINENLEDFIIADYKKRSYAQINKKYLKLAEN